MLSIVYNAIVPYRDTVNYEVFITDLQGSDAINLTNHPAVDWVCHGWKNMIYFISDRDTTAGFYFLYRYDLSRNKIDRIGNHQMANSWLDSRYDGSELVICRQEGKFRSFSIIDSTGYEVREFLRTNQYLISDPAFSPDGKWVVFRSTRSGVDELWISDELGAHQRQLTHYPANLDDPGPQYYHAGPPCWIPATNYISFTSRRSDEYHIFRINADGSQELQLTSDPGNQGWHTWTPDGKKLIYDGDQGQNSSDLYLLDFPSQKLLKLTDTPYPERAPIIIDYDSHDVESS